MLETDDVINVPKRPSHVVISGSVQSPLMAQYEKNKNIDDYISDAGGFNRIADIKRIYILLPNGQGFQSRRIKEKKGA